MGRKNKSNASMGHALVNAKEAADHRFKQNPSKRHSAKLNMGYPEQSVTEETSLDEFLRTAELAGTEFTAERRNMVIVPTLGSSVASLNRIDEKSIEAKHIAKRDLLRIPRRPPWTSDMTAEELAKAETEAFLEWRRGLAELQEDENLTITPFEKNLEFWRQLWRVIERSDVIAQIVDARNPLLFRCEDVEKYAQEIDPTKRCVLIINKADLLTHEQRKVWAEYFSNIGVRIAFFTAVDQEDSEALTGADELARTLLGESFIPSDGRRSTSGTTSQERSEGDADSSEAEYNSGDDDDDDDDDDEDDDDDGDGDGDQHEHGAGKELLDTQNSGAVVTGNMLSDGSLLPTAQPDDTGGRDSSDAEYNSGESDGDDNVKVSNSGLGHKARALGAPAVGQSGENQVQSGAAVSHKLGGAPRDEVDGGDDDNDDWETDDEDENDDSSGTSTPTPCNTIPSLGDADASLPIVNSPEILPCASLVAYLKSVVSSRQRKSTNSTSPLTVGLIGYPNVGKSSIINRLIGDKKVSVSATPGKTKHFQTIHLEPGRLILCDCPGLVMPSFVVSKAHMLLLGILPVNQMRDSVPPIAIVCTQIPREVLQKMYGLTLPNPDPLATEDTPDPQDLLSCLAYIKGFMGPSGTTDWGRAGRVLVKDYINGRFGYAYPPPNVDAGDFNKGLSKVANTIREQKELKKQEAIEYKMAKSGLGPAKLAEGPGGVSETHPQLEAMRKHRLLITKTSTKSLDARFFANKSTGFGIKPVAGGYGSRPVNGSAQDGGAEKGPERKKHFNSKKREKLRRIHKDLDNY